MASDPSWIAPRDRFDATVLVTSKSPDESLKPVSRMMAVEVAGELDMEMNACNKPGPESVRSISQWEAIPGPRTCPARVKVHASERSS